MQPRPRFTPKRDRSRARSGSEHPVPGHTAPKALASRASLWAQHQFAAERDRSVVRSGSEHPVPGCAAPKALSPRASLWAQHQVAAERDRSGVRSGSEHPVPGRAAPKVLSPRASLRTEDRSRGARVAQHPLKKCKSAPDCGQHPSGRSGVGPEPAQEPISPALREQRESDSFPEVPCGRRPGPAECTPPPDGAGLGQSPLWNRSAQSLARSAKAIPSPRFPAGDGPAPRSVNMRDRPRLNQTKIVFF